MEKLLDDGVQMSAPAFLNEVSKFNIIRCIRQRYDDYPIFTSGFESEEPCLGPHIQFAKNISVSRKTIESARFDLLIRSVECLIAGFGVALEKHIINNLEPIRINNNEIKNTRAHMNNSVFSPEFLDQYNRNNPLGIMMRSVFNTFPLESYSLGPNQFITIEEDRPSYFAYEDNIQIIDNPLSVDIICSVTLSFDFGGYKLYEVNNG